MRHDHNRMAAPTPNRFQKPPKPSRLGAFASGATHRQESGAAHGGSALFRFFVDEFNLSRRERWRRQVFGFLCPHPADGFPDGFTLVVETLFLNQTGNVLLLFFRECVSHVATVRQPLEKCKSRGENLPTRPTAQRGGVLAGRMQLKTGHRLGIDCW